MPITAIHPGEHLAEELQALAMSASELARKIAVPTNRVTQILNGTRGVSRDTALPSRIFFLPLRLAQERSGKSIKALPPLKRSGPVNA